MVLTKFRVLWPLSTTKGYRGDHQAHSHAPTVLRAAMSSDFKAAADWLSTSPGAAQLTDRAKLEIYGLYKYVLTGAGP